MSDQKPSDEQKPSEPSPENQDSTNSQEPSDQDQYDDLGYKIEGKGDDEQKSKEGEKPKEEEKKPEPEEGVKNPASGYGEEPPAEPKEEEPEPEKKEGDKEEGELKLDVEGLAEKEVESIREFSKQHKLPKEVAQALVAQRRAENAALDESIEQAKQDREKALQQRKVDWHNELKNDPDFGGDKFAFNIKRSEKVLEEFLPETKKALTKAGGMLPPSVMKDLAKLAEHLYSKENTKQGDPIVDKKSEEEADDPLAFYG